MSIANDLQVVLLHKAAVTLRGEFGVTLRAEVTPRNEYSLLMQCADGWEQIILVGNRGDVLMQRALFGCVAETVAATLKDAADKAVQVAAASTKPVRCTWYRDIRRCYAIAREAGLDVKADAAMRAAFARFLGRDVPSRDVLDGDDWFLVGNAIKSRELAW